MKCIEIYSEHDIPTHLPTIEQSLKPADRMKMWCIQQELEIELGFAQQEHLMTAESLDDFPGLTSDEIESAIQRGIHNPMTNYRRPPDVTGQTGSTLR